MERRGERSGLSAHNFPRAGSVPYCFWEMTVRTPLFVCSTFGAPWLAFYANMRETLGLRLQFEDKGMRPKSPRAAMFVSMDKQIPRLMKALSIPWFAFVEVRRDALRIPGSTAWIATKALGRYVLKSRGACAMDNHIHHSRASRCRSRGYSNFW
jgi:hypothetical protein